MSTGTPRWKTVPLGTLAEFRNGLNYNKNNFGKGIKVINVKDFQDRLIAVLSTLDEINPEGVLRKDDLLRDGDILFVRSNGNRDLIGRSLFIKGITEPVSHSAFTIKVRFASAATLPRFYAYLFRSQLIRQVLSARGGGTNISNLNQGILSSLEVPCPPLLARRKIAAILSAYDDLIENNTRRIAILEQMAQAIYREWFVAFHFPGHEKVKMVDSPLGKIPVGWEVNPFSTIADYINGFAFKPSHWGESGKPIVKIAELKNGVTDKTPRNHGEDIPTQFHITNRDVLFSWSADIDVYVWSHGPGLLNQHLFNVIPKSGFGKLFLYFALKNRMQEFRNRSLGTTMRHIKRSALEQVLIAIPTTQQRQAFEMSVEPIVQESVTLTAKNRNLHTTRDFLLPKLISGQIDVENMDIAVDESNGDDDAEPQATKQKPRK